MCGLGDLEPDLKFCNPGVWLFQPVAHSWKNPGGWGREDQLQWSGASAGFRADSGRQCWRRKEDHWLGME